MELEAYYKALAIIKEKKRLDEDYEKLDEIKGSLPCAIVFEYMHDYTLKMKAHPIIFKKVIETAINLVEERQKELEQQLKEL